MKKPKKTWTYFHTRNILLVMKLLGHKNIRNTLKYTQLVEFPEEEEEYEEVATATTDEEIRNLDLQGSRNMMNAQ